MSDNSITEIFIYSKYFIHINIKIWSISSWYYIQVYDVMDISMAK